MPGVLVAFLPSAYCRLSLSPPLHLIFQLQNDGRQMTLPRA